MNHSDKAGDLSLRHHIAEIIEANENRVRIIDFGVAYDSNKG